MRYATAELDLLVGSLFTVQEAANRKQFRKERTIIVEVQQQLAAAGVAFDFLKDPGNVAWEGGIETMGDLYQLSRLAVYLGKNMDITGVLHDGPVLPETIDSAITAVWRGKARTAFPHLVFFKGINSYYLPVDFEAPLWLPFKNTEKTLDEAYFGSAVRLEQELQSLQPLLVQAQVSTDSAAYRCLDVLLTGAQKSLETGLPLIVW